MYINFTHRVELPHIMAGLPAAGIESVVLLWIQPDVN